MKSFLFYNEQTQNLTYPNYRNYNQINTYIEYKKGEATNQ